jgi:hypothetical protein
MVLDKGYDNLGGQSNKVTWGSSLRSGTVS